MCIRDRLGYDLQAAFYQDGIKAITGRTLPFYFIAVEKDGPQAAAVYRDVYKRQLLIVLAVR